MPETPEELLVRLAATPPDTYPREVLGEMISRLDEMVPALLVDLERIAADPDSFDEERDTLRLIFSAFLLAQARATRAFQPIVALLSLSEDQNEGFWGDSITEDMGRILASVYDGNESSLHDLIENPAHAEYVRGATAIHAFEALARVGRIPLGTLESYYGELLVSKLEREPSLVWDALVGSASEFGFVALLPAMKRAFAEGLCDPLYETFENLAKTAEANAKSGAMPPEASYRALVADTIAETEWWVCFQPAAERWHAAEEFSPGEYSGFIPREPLAPYVREAPKIGRNDPCPCGSGKKFKKCCG